MSKLSRRTFLAFGLLSSQALLAACGGGGGEAPAARTADTGTAAPAAPAEPAAPATPSAPPAAPAPPPVWNVRQNFTFVAGAAVVIDLNTTLPAGVARGGTFSVDASGARLPPGVTLSPNGVLTVDASAPLNVASGVVFAYSAA